MRSLIFVVAGIFLAIACDSDPDCHGPECASPTTTSGGDGGNGGEASKSAAEDYCDCMLTSCHDAYHATYGPETDEEAARANCLDVASGLPVAGMDVTEGNFVECRMHYCLAGGDDPTVCDSAIGQGSCAP